MRKRFLLFCLFSLSSSVFSLDLFHEVSAGYHGDLGVSMALRLEDPTPDFPFFAQLRGGYIYQGDPGNATEARKIFINDNSGGNIEKYGESYLIGIDLGWKWREMENYSVEFILSGLWNYYSAHYTFIGNNEAFSVTSSPFGIGAGAAMRIPLSNTDSFFMLKGGAEYFFKSRLDAHGTYFYSPDGDDDRPRNNYTYEDADAAVNQPELRTYLQLGVLYPIG